MSSQRSHFSVIIEQDTYLELPSCCQLSFLVLTRAQSNDVASNYAGYQISALVLSSFGDLGGLSFKFLSEFN